MSARGPHAAGVSSPTVRRTDPQGLQPGSAAPVLWFAGPFLGSTGVLCLLLVTFWAAASFAGEVIPPAPPKYFNDYSGVVSPDNAQRLNLTLEEFERSNSSQIVVAVYPKMQSDSSIEDYTIRVAESWKVGQKGKNNGAVLFVFIQDRKMYLQVGYGLEGALPDALAKQIIENEIKPRFRNGDYDGGLTAGVNAILAAVRGEYKGSGHTVNEGRAHHRQDLTGFIFFLIFFGLIGLVLFSRLRKAASGTVYRRRGYSTWGGWGGGGWGGGWGSGGGGGWSSGGGGGGFSGGGGSFGGGGAGGSW